VRDNSVQKVLSRILILTAGLATILVLPDTAFDPINVPKLVVIVVGGFMAAGGLVAHRKYFLQSKYRLVQIFAVTFIVDLTLVLLISGTNFNQEFYGAFGRSTGFLAYFSLCMLFLAAVLASQVSTLPKIVWAFLATGGASVVYGSIQALDADPINWIVTYSPVMGFLGNPNFQSSFIGFNGIVAFALMIGIGKRPIRILMVLDLAASIFVIRATESQQGFLVLAGGVSIVTLIWIKNSMFKVALIPALALSFVSAFFVALGSLNSGPLASLLYKASVTYRGDYWRAGWKMTTEHPFFGVGLDSYGDWYRRTRSIEATLRRGPDVFTNAAHNVLLDLSSNGGFPLLLIYLFMVGLVLISAWKVLRRTNTFDPIFSGLFAVWVAYQAQSIISLNQIGLVVWGWIISGLIIGYEINTRTGLADEFAKHPIKKSKNSLVNTQKVVSAGVVVSIFVGGLTGLAMSLPALVASTTFFSALQSRDAILVQKAAYISPSEPIYMSTVIDILVRNKFLNEAITVSNDSINLYKDVYAIWSTRSKIEGLPQAEIDRALKEMNRLDPNDPNLK
jgi:O-antigen ligase